MLSISLELMSLLRRQTSEFFPQSGTSPSQGLHRWRTAWLIACLALTFLAACGQPKGRSIPAVSPAIGHSLDQSGSLKATGWGIFRATLSPDGREVAFWGMDPDGDFVIGIGRNGKPVPVTPSTMQASDYAWMPDSRCLLVSYRVGNQDQLAIFDLDGRIVRKLRTTTAFRNEFDDGMTVRSDGKTAIIAGMAPGQGTEPTDLLEVDLQSGRVTALTHTAGISYFFPNFADSHDVVLVAGTANSPDAPSPELRLLDRTTGVMRKLSQSSQAVVSASAPYGLKEVVYEVFGGYGNSSLWLVPIPDGIPRELQGHGYLWPSLDPTGQWILVGEVGTPSSPGGLKLIPAIATTS
jgi:hypothetical protein